MQSLLLLTQVDEREREREINMTSETYTCAVLLITASSFSQQLFLPGDTYLSHRLCQRLMDSVTLCN